MLSVFCAKTRQDRCLQMDNVASDNSGVNRRGDRDCSSLKKSVSQTSLLAWLTTLDLADCFAWRASAGKGEGFLVAVFIVFHGILVLRFK